MFKEKASADLFTISRDSSSFVVANLETGVEEHVFGEQFPKVLKRLIQSTSFIRSCGDILMNLKSVYRPGEAL